MTDYQKTLRSFFKYDQFRPLQEDIIRAVGDDRKDTLGLLPTGGGKSLLFQIPTLAHQGLCLVITPLIALMNDQVANLKKLKINALAIHSGLSTDEIKIALDHCIHGDVKFLYLSPERLANELFLSRLPDMPVSLLAVDEAHCISQWGYDFRPSYLKIADIRPLIPDVPVLALTATATPKVVDDIQKHLHFRTKNVFRKSFERANLHYIVRHVEEKNNYLVHVFRKEQGCGIVYVRSRKHSRELAELLERSGITADYYHAGLKYESRQEKQQRWQSGYKRVMVATNAFGMGIDKPDVRVVLHYDLPDSPEAYFQEAGRAGRDGLPAYALLLYHPNDRDRMLAQHEAAFPDRKTIKAIYNAICNYLQIPIGSGKGLVFKFRLGDFARQYHFSIVTIYNSIKLLQKEGYLELTEDLKQPSRLRFVVNRDDLYKFQVKNARFDNFIKLLLRSYTGLFTDYVQIDENILAAQSSSSRELIYQYLLRLSNAHIINYIPQRRGELLIFHEERLDERSLFISKVHREDRQNSQKERLQAMLSYAESNTVCRSQQLLAYFGETNAPPCKQCDVCAKKHKTAEKHKDISQQILSLLDDKPLSISELLSQLKSDEQMILSLLRQLQDHGLIVIDDQQNVSKVDARTF